MRTKFTLFTIEQASKWASEYLNKNVTRSNISYLLSYGRVRKFNSNGKISVAKSDLLNYYQSYNGSRENKWKKKLGSDLNWALSFEEYKEKETTKHVHRLHPYKGKFIPQMVEYFLDGHTDTFKKDTYFQEGDLVLDPFCGCGTTLIEANELGMHAVGIDISAFNSMITNVKLGSYDLRKVTSELRNITNKLGKFIYKSDILRFNHELKTKLSEFNKTFFPSPAFRRKVRMGEINEKKYGKEKAEKFIYEFENLVDKYNIQILQDENKTFLDKWYVSTVRNEIDLLFNLVKKIGNTKIKKLAATILSRTIRTCRATTHANLATLNHSVTKPYYCKKHGKICKPLFTTYKWWQRYCKDTVKRIKQFQSLRTDTHQICLAGDSRNIEIKQQLSKKMPDLTKLLKEKKFQGIFTSPPYVGLIDYHEQHAYAYDLFGFERKDENEIGPLFRGKSKKARQLYIQGISDVLIHSQKYLVDDCDIFLVANDKFNMYPKIAERSNLKIINKYKRPVLNRTEKDKNAYSEIIFHLKRK